MSGDNEVSVKVAANTGELKPGMEAAANAVKSSVEQMQGAFKGLEGVLAGIQSHILAFTAVMAGGALFGSSIKAANDWNSEVTKISKTMGMTTEQASIMAVALDHIGVSTDTFTHASTMMTRQLSANEGAFGKLGVATRDANTGAFRPTGDIMADVNAKLKSIQNTTERNAAGMKVYGRSWEEVRTILKLTPEAMKEAEETAKRLHLIVGPEGEAMTRKYKEEMRDFHLILNSLSVQIGNALLPVMMKLGAFMGEEGPAMGDVFKKVIQSIAFAAGATWLTLKDMGDGIGAMAAQAVALLHGDLAGFKAIGAERDKQAAENEAAYERLKASMFDDGPMKTGGKTEEDDAHIDFNKGAKDQIAAWKSTLEQAHEVEGQYFKDSLQDDLAFWNEKLTHVKAGSKEERAVRHELYALHKQDAQANLVASVADIEYQITLAKNDSAQKVALAKQESELIKNTYGEKSKEYILQLRKVADAERAHRDEMRQLEAGKLDAATKMAKLDLDLEREKLNYKKDMGQLSDMQFLQAMQSLAETEYQTQHQSMTDKAALYDDDLKNKQKVLEAIAELEKQHAVTLQKNANDMAKTQKKEIEGLLAPITSAIEKSITGMIQGTLTMQKALSGIFQAILGEFVSMAAKRAATWVTNEALQTSATVAGSTARTAVGAAASTASIAQSGASVLANIGNYALEVFAGIYKALAAIPFIGPFIAPVAAAGGMAAVAGMAGSVKSSAGGEWQVPGDRMQLVHKDETIIPATEAAGLRNMIAGGGSGGGDVHLHVHTQSTQDFARFLKTNSHTMAPALRQMARNFTPIKV